MSGNDQSTSITRLAELLGDEVDWEPRLREQPWMPRRRAGWSGL
ncbi:MAG: hypothetical protein AB7N76_30475 [Planctomycetota bacterium]